MPHNTSLPTVSGNAHEGETLTASNGTWDNAPTKFAYQWQRCSDTGTACADITGAMDKTYTVTTQDSDHTLRVIVTASNADGQSTAGSKASDLVSSRNDPVNTVKPSVTGTAQVGEELTASTGTWTGGVRSYSYQWQRCQVGGSSCVDVSGANGKTYGVRVADVGNVLRVNVTATNSSGTTDASSATTATVRSTPGGTATTTTTTTTTTRGNKAPTIAFLGLRRIGPGVYARFRVCDDSRKAVTITARDVKGARLAYTRRFAVTPLSCSVASRHWVPASRFRTPGKLVVTLKATDKSGASSRTVSRALSF